MKEGDFDKKISEKLKNDDSKYPNMDKNWEKVVKKMAEIQSSKPTAGGMVVLPDTQNTQSKQKSPLIPWLLASMLLLLGSNGWLFWRLSESNNKPNVLTTNNTVSPKTVRLYDTIIETKVIYKIDTIYKKVIINTTYSTQNNKNELSDNQIITSSTPSVFSPNTVATTGTKHILEGTATTKPVLDGKTGVTNAYKEDKTSEISHVLNDSEQNKHLGNHNHINISVPFAQPYTNTDSLNGNHVNNVIQPKNDSVKLAAVPYDSLELKPQQGLSENIIIKPSRKKLVIDHYGLGLQGGYSWEFPAINDLDKGNWIGLAGEMAFNKHLRLSVSADYMSIHYKTTMRNPLLELPNDPPMTENYKLKYIESEPSSVLASLSVSYFLKPKSKYNPFLTIGYRHRWIIPHTVEFEFTNKITGDERSFKIENYHHTDKWLLFGAGVETALSSNIFGQLKAEYIYDSNHGNKPLNYFLLRGGIFYRF